MSDQRPSSPTAFNYRDQPIFWFAILDRAVEKGDHTQAAEAQRELERLGVRVRYGIRPQSRQRLTKGGD